MLQPSSCCATVADVRAPSGRLDLSCEEMPGFARMSKQNPLWDSRRCDSQGIDDACTPVCCQHDEEELVLCPVSCRPAVLVAAHRRGPEVGVAAPASL